VGAVTEEQIKDYIEKHQEEPPDENFSIDEFQSYPSVGFQPADIERASA
jgi:hypothetical protein